MRRPIARVAIALGLAAAIPAAVAAQVAPPDARAGAEKRRSVVADGASTGVIPGRLRDDSTTRDSNPILLTELSAAVPGAEHSRVPTRPVALRSLGARAQDAPQSWWPPLASAILPGAGQGILGQDRALAYLAVESYGWIRYASDIREGRRQRHAYRALAAQVARAYLSESRPVGDFEYYERMEHYIESGVFDASPDAGIQPETNPESFNGFIWLRARTTFWEDPAIPPAPTSQPYFAALEYYSDRAIQPQFRWSWRNAQLEQDLFRRTIGRSNDAFRRSIQDLGVIIANHALSTVDAYVTVRIRHAREANGVGFEASIPWSPRRPGNNAGGSSR
jgi:hypothetical protein